MLRKALVAFMTLAFVGGILYAVEHYSSTTEATNPAARATTTAAQATSTYPADWVQAAQKAYNDVLHKKELEKEASSTQSQIQALTNQEAALAKKKQDLKDHLDSIDKQLSF